MKKIKKEYDESENVVNIHAEWAFFRCKEYSAVLASSLMNYKLYLNVCKKNNFVFLECWFPAASTFKFKSLLKELGYNYKIYV
jgi:hypothetical protein